jgi:hypothetical protein
MQRLTSDFTACPTYPVEQYTRLYISQLATEYPNAHLFDLRSGLCTEDECRFAENNMSFYWDREHLTSLGAQAALSRFDLSRLSNNGEKAR